MKKLNKFNIIHVIEANLSLPSIKRDLEANYKFLDLSFLKNPKYIKYYMSWQEDKKEAFIKLIGGKVNFKRTKEFLENTFQEQNK